MKKWVRMAEHLLFALNVLIVFLFVFESRIVLPPWIQVMGRMHPLVLHFPIALILLVVVLYFLRPWLKVNNGHEWLKGMLLISALTTSLTIIMGLFLSREQNYTEDILFWHKWLGVAVGFLIAGCYYYEGANFPVMGFKVGSVFLLVVLILTAHFGAELTHGKDFLFAPVRLAETHKHIPLDEALVYDHIIAPILEEKCASCHNESKAKGKLILTSQEGIVKGGKAGKLFEIDSPGEGIFLQRIHLPESDKKHMPPKNKAQLTDDEVEILEQWIRTGTELEKKVLELPVDDTLRVMIETYLKPEEEMFDFGHAQVEEIEKLNSAYRVIYPLATNSPALSVSIYNAALFSPKLIEELTPLQKQIVSLDLNKMPVKDSDLKIISGFENLRKLNLNFSDITGETFSALTSLKHLSSLSISSSKVNDKGLAQLSQVKSLKDLYCWNTSVSEETLAQLRTALPGLQIETGFVPDHTRILKLTPPRILNDPKIYDQDFKIELGHPIEGVTIRYTLDGSTPDSLKGEVYAGGVDAVTAVTAIRAIAFKDGWFGSEVVSASFYKSSIRPDSIWFTSLPERKFFSKGAATLIDGESGIINFGSYEGWVGFRENKMEAHMIFTSPVKMNSVTLSTRHDHGAHLFPPQAVTVWGGMEHDKMKLLSTLTPSQPSSYGSGMVAGLECIFPKQEIQYIRIVVEPVAKLPQWHKNKGEKAWFFVDELLFN